MKKTAGIHHITAIVGHPQENVDFYAGILGLRMIKQTVNFDDPEVYHLYFGDEGGKPGTIITFFPWANAQQGKIGDGQVGVTTYVVPAGALSFWEQRLAEFKIGFEKSHRFGEDYLAFNDVHGLQLELVAREAGEKNTYEFAGITSDVAIKGFGGATLFTHAPLETAKVLESTMGLEKIGEENGLWRFQSSADIGNIIDLNRSSVGAGVQGVGTVHHIAWRAQDEADHLAWKQQVMDKGQRPTPVKDRNYFKALYFREAGGILFEIASDTPGFAHDESYETMGKKLMLPEQLEAHRDQVVSNLIPFEVRELK